ncbi:MAG: DUF1624 domain-containing protein [Candidatus Aminicenantes bacterium]|nr:MAG: DUF1624 domain-containing protein [Candidatus Aminicenantes bacterium]
MELALVYRPKRLIPLDALPGLIMILMAIDHANYFVARMHPTGEFWGLALPQYNNIAEFLTRYVTHICAPGFFFLMGVGMVLFANSRRSLGWSESKISRHLFFRGLTLIFCQFILVNSAWVLGPVYTFRPPGAGKTVLIYFSVLATLGVTMVIGTLFLQLKTSLHIGLSTIIILGAQFLIPDPSHASQLYSPLLRIICVPGRTGILQSFYPIIPWLGIVLFGFVFGKWLLEDRSQAYKRALLVGSIFIVLFFIIRILGGFGNIHPQARPGLISFLNVTKYPPSLAFILSNIGLCLVIIWIISQINDGFQRWGKPFLVFGRSPLFFYILHLYLYAIIGLFFASRGGSGLEIMYPIWLVGLFILYALCFRYGTFKKKKSADSIWRFF